MIATKTLGITLYVLGVWAWIAAALWLVLRAITCVLPTWMAAFLAGVAAHAHWTAGRVPWPAVREWRLWEYLRGAECFDFRVTGDPEGVRLMREEMLRIEGASEGRPRRILWAIYPHGHFCVTHVLWWLLNPAFAHARGAAHALVFYVPVVRAFARWLDCVTVSEGDITGALRTGNGRVFMCPGGLRDMRHATGDAIVERTGFLRVARETGATVVPVWCPDERQYYATWRPLGRALEPWLGGFPAPTFTYGRWLLLPRIPATGSRIYVGRPIRCGGSDTRTAEELRAEYMTTMRRLQDAANAFVAVDAKAKKAK